MTRNPTYVIEPGQVWRSVDGQERAIIAVHTTQPLDQSTIKFLVGGRARTTGRPSFISWVYRSKAVCR